jgi:rhodanese-related sulfurtransferase
VKRSLPVLGLALLLGVLAACSGAREPGSLIGPQEAYELVQAGEAVLIDVRDEASYVDAHLSGALLVPPAQTGAAAERLAARERTLIIYCNCPQEVTSIAVANDLIARGVDDVLVLEGGIRAWALEGLPLRAGARP